MPRLVGQIELWSDRLPSASLARPSGPSRPGEPARQPGASADRLGGQLRRPARHAHVVQAQARRGAPGIPAKHCAGARFSVRSRRCWPSIIRMPGPRPSSTPSRRRGCIRRSTGSPAPRGCPRRRPTCCTSRPPGWAVIPALVHKQLHGTDMLLTEHGVYVREAYLAAARSPSSQGERFLASRLARGLSRAAYAAADSRGSRHRGERRLGARAGRGPAEDPRDPERDRRAGRLHRSAGQPEGGLRGADRSPQGRADDAARGRRGQPPGSRSAASSTGARPPKARRPTRGRAKSSRAGSAPRSAFASWVAPTIRMASCAMRTWC